MPSPRAAAGRPQTLALLALHWVAPGAILRQVLLILYVWLRGSSLLFNPNHPSSSCSSSSNSAIMPLRFAHFLNLVRAVGHFFIACCPVRNTRRNRNVNGQTPQAPPPEDENSPLIPTRRPTRWELPAGRLRSRRIIPASERQDSVSPSERRVSERRRCSHRRLSTIEE